MVGASVASSNNNCVTEADLVIFGVAKDAFIEELESLGFKGNYVIEREGGDNRAEEIGLAAERLTK